MRAFLLDNRRSRQAKKDLLATYRAQTARPPAIAGLSYAADPIILRNELTEYGFGDDLSRLVIRGGSRHAGHHFAPHRLYARRARLCTRLETGQGSRS